MPVRVRPYSYGPSKSGKEMYCERVPLREIARGAGTPTYVYSGTDIVARYRELDGALRGYPHQVCFAVKANSNLSILRLLARQGAGFDIVSGGELYRVIEAGGEPRKTVFSGVGKSAEELDYGIRQGVRIFNCESESELILLDERARRAKKRVLAGLRVNPQVNARTHPYISTGLKDHKFGIPIREAEKLYLRAQSFQGVRMEGLSCHIGSQITDLRAFGTALTKMTELADLLRGKGAKVTHLDAGGGIAVAYQDHEKAPSLSSYAATVLRCMRNSGLKLYVEPGRALVAEAGVLLTRVLHIKADSHKRFVIIDAAMNDLIRPSLYGAHHDIQPVSLPSRNGQPPVVADIVGPVCESGDFLARDYALSLPHVGDLLAIETAGAYGFVMSSNYNSRPRSAEVLVKGSQWKVVRRRERLADLVRGESA